MKQAWFCPSCQKHHGPHVDTCPGVADAVSDKHVSPFDGGRLLNPQYYPTRWPMTPHNPPYWYQEPWLGPSYTIT